MLVVETIGRIRREHLVKGKSIKEIARDLKISRNTVRKILRSGETSFSYEREVQPRPRLGRWKADLDRMLTANTETSARLCHGNGRAIRRGVRADQSHAAATASNHCAAASALKIRKVDRETRWRWRLK